jgi:hypothetical protein
MYVFIVNMVEQDAVVNLTPAYSMGRGEQEQ